ncbi:ras-related protein Rab-26-like isoform X1 [Salvelinus sp. IW2-2015]|uniref:ras-related protein Rab-26-like isoform X1 n=1 Tax=Salvelinus sp. IW2-2015 TaxID=2691554 RepID=UPI000CEABF17|nr:ras-related protein Rab-26-like isoform X1 [Salvelinus alpinus]
MDIIMENIPEMECVDQGEALHSDSAYGSSAVDTDTEDCLTPLEITFPYNEDLMHKTIMVGDSGVGKTSLLVQYDQGKFIPGSFSATVGIGFTNKVVTVDNVKVKLQIWDTAGQERFRSVTHAYYRDAQALLLLYDITSKSSFDNIRVRNLSCHSSLLLLISSRLLISPLLENSFYMPSNIWPPHYITEVTSTMTFHDISKKPLFKFLKVWG